MRSKTVNVALEYSQGEAVYFVNSELQCLG